MNRAGRILLLLLALVVGSADPAKAGAVGPITITASPFVDLSEQVEWCETDPAEDIAAVAAGGCAFAPATARDLTRGYSTRAYWLRLTLENPQTQPIERWLRIGHPRLERVSFFEASADLGWQRRHSGIGIPMAQRPVFSADAVLRIALSPGESRVVLVRVTSKAVVDLKPTLWQTDAYLKALTERTLSYSVVVGVKLMVCLFSLIIFLQWREPAYLYFGILEFCTATITFSYSGLLQVFLWPANLAYDLRLQAFAIGSGIVIFTLFTRRFIGLEGRYRPYHAVMSGTSVVAVLGTGWTGLIDYGLGMSVLMLCGMIALGAAVALYWRAWRNGFKPAGYLLLAHAIVLTGLAHTYLTSFQGGPSSEAADLVFILVFVPGAPISLFGISMYRQQLEDRLAALQKESAARVEFLARMSHELRTPLDTILGTAQLLSKPSGRSNLAEGLADIRESGRHLLSMIDDILDHARGLAGRLTIVPMTVDLGRFLHGIGNAGRILAARNGNQFTLQIDGPLPPGVQLDERRLRQVLDNLLANAARHTRSGWIRLDCTIGAVAPDGRLPIDFAIVDNGEGIALADQERIFLPFERGRQTVSRRGGKGAGMGLAIARHIVELMGGELTVASRPGEGACFRFAIRVELAEGGQALPGPAPPLVGYGGRRRTLLVVEDEAKSRNILATFLRDSGFHVLEAGSGREALEQCTAKGDGIDLVLTDQFMADGDGWMVLGSLAASRPDLPVVSISAAPPDRPAGVPSTLAFAAHQLKPLEHGEVLRCICDLLGLDPLQDQPPPKPPDDLAVAAAEARPEEPALAELRRMIAGGEVSAIIRWTESLGAADPTCAEFAERTRLAASALDFPALNRLAEATRR